MILPRDHDHADDDDDRADDPVGGDRFLQNEVRGDKTNDVADREQWVGEREIDPRDHAKPEQRAAEDEGEP